jgi:Zn-dependent peptidase ImmA (M78 family)
MSRPRSTEIIRREARKVLDQLKIRTAPIPVDKIASALGAKIKYAPYEGEIAGMLVRGKDETVIGVNSLHHPNRQRFTIAHELGHLLLHKDEVHIDRAFRNSISSQAIDPHEIEANRFAAELLMPLHILNTEDISSIDVEDESNLLELAQKFKVSLQAMTLRIINILHI